MTIEQAQQAQQIAGKATGKEAADLLDVLSDVELLLEKGKDATAQVELALQMAGRQEGEVGKQLVNLLTN